MRLLPHDTRDLIFDRYHKKVLNLLESLETTTQQTDYAPASRVPYVLRRFPAKPEGVLALQGGDHAVLQDDDPFSPGFHMPLRSKTQPLALGDTVPRANSRKPHVILLDQDVLIQVVPATDCCLNSLLLFAQPWYSLSASGQLFSPPWAELERDDCLSLWPSGCSLSGGDYTPLLQHARVLLTNLAAAHLIEVDLCMRLTSPLLRRRQIVEHMEVILNGTEAHHGWTRVQTHQRAAMLLVALVASAQYIGPLVLSAGVSKTRTSISLWEDGFGAMKLAWRLLQPREGGLFGRDELTLDALQAMTLLEDAMRPHSAYVHMSKVVRKLLLVAAQNGAGAPLPSSSGITEQAAGTMNQSWRRLFHFHLVELVAYRFWKDIRSDITLGQLLKPLAHACRSARPVPRRKLHGRTPSRRRAGTANVSRWEVLGAFGHAVRGDP
ncbi:hypothetical protein K437DRAFT_142623 [Tilletiaria anomala UBC 951]|uniref:Uncharacterized protein n=1 Tax=Tilletiaria anomala (strain ATCC 24038 / CBS 436.72 / UBC 951) TaxID=1037660 RepID=A0A066VZV7_TILAU|nr:uncharacterized protein K437DRAFT_142623 [Tilletiaria anomala UBC 951]KDN44080.1 hypothetical protein K437DRAFT_142623 [Tilletiaria anomala UBC 951]